MRGCLVMVLIAIGLISRGASAQGDLPVAAGDLVRIHAVSLPESWVTGTVLSITPDTIHLIASRNRGPVAVPRMLVFGVERGRPGSRAVGFGRGLAVGAFAGGFVGGVVAYLSADKHTWSRESTILLGAMIGTMGGGIVGGVVGAELRGTRWESVYEAAHVAPIARASGGGGVEVGVRVGF